MKHKQPNTSLVVRSVPQTQGEGEFPVCAQLLSQAVRGSLPEPEWLMTFAGRTRQKRALGKFLDSSNKTICILTGEAGAGKSFLAMRFAVDSLNNQKALSYYVPARDLERCLPEGAYCERKSSVCERGTSTGRSPAREACFSVLRSCASGSPRRSSIPQLFIIDGLNETGNYRKMRSFVQNFCSSFCTSTPASGRSPARERMKLLLTCRTDEWDSYFAKALWPIHGVDVRRHVTEVVIGPLNSQEKAAVSHRVTKVLGFPEPSNIDYEKMPGNPLVLSLSLYLQSQNRRPSSLGFYDVVRAYYEHVRTQLGSDRASALDKVLDKAIDQHRLCVVTRAKAIVGIVKRGSVPELLAEETDAGRVAIHFSHPSVAEYAVCRRLIEKQRWAELPKKDRIAKLTAFLNASSSDRRGEQVRPLGEVGSYAIYELTRVADA